MPETKFTANRNLPSPTGKDFVPEGPAEIEALAKALDEENAGDIDFLQAGIVKSTDWSFIATMENSAACALASTGTTGGIAWLPNATIGLVRSSTPSATLKALVPASKPAAGKYMSVGFQLAPGKWGEAAIVSVVSGVEKSTQAEAEAAPAGEVAGRLRIRDVVILNTAGVYSIVHQADRRPWATGGEAANESAAEGEIGAESVTGKKIAKGTITGDKLAIKAPFGSGGWEPGKEYEPSATKPSIVVLRFGNYPSNGGKVYWDADVYVGSERVASSAKELPEGATGRPIFDSVTFPVPAGSKWKVVLNSGELESGAGLQTYSFLSF